MSINATHERYKPARNRMSMQNTVETCSFRDSTIQNVDMVYVDPPFNTGKHRGNYNDNYTLKDHETLLTDLAARAHDALQPNGVLFLHVDWRCVTEARMACDKVFGRNRFLNEIIWKYNSGGATQSRFSRKHDNILFYSKSKEYTFNTPLPNYQREACQLSCGRQSHV